jgi:nucleotide-binding universal stress UspA family protein
MAASPLALSRHPFRSLLVATDLSSSAQAPLERAFRLPLTPDAVVHVLHVVEVPPTPATELERHVALHETAKRSRRDDAHVNTIPTVLRGDPATEIDLHARLTDAELIIVGRGGAESGEAVGLTTTAVLSAVDRPVLVVGTEPSGESYRAPLVAVELDMVSADLLVLTSRVVPKDLPEVRLVHVFAASFEGTRGLMGNSLNRWGERFRTQAQARLDELVTALPESTIAWHTHVAHGDPAIVVPKQARDLAADLVVLGTHRRTGVARWVLGSVASEILRRVSCDALIVPAPDQERAFPPRLPLSSQQA